MTTLETQKLAMQLVLAVTRGGPAPVKILLVEDNLDDVFVARMAFNNIRVPYELYVARDGQEALDLLFSDDKSIGSSGRIVPDLILLDLGLPRITGMEVLQEINASNELADVPVIMLTASDRPGDIVKSDKLGARAYLQKPMEVEQFIHTIRTLREIGIAFAELPKREAAC